MNSAYAEHVITDNLKQKMAVAKSDELIRINIRLEEQYHNESLDEKYFRDPIQRREFVVSELKAFSKDSQKGLLTFLSGQEKNNKVSDVRPLWIVNLVNCYADKETIEEIAGKSGITMIDYDAEQQVLDPDFYNKLTIVEADKLQNKSSIAWHVSHINAPAVWQQGYSGESVVVAVLDSGVNYNHQDLAGQMWTHPDYPYHGYNFIENNNNPMDYFFHGTHVAGIVAGNGTAGSTTGIAPAASIMAIKVLSNNGGGTQWGVWAGIQFGVEHGAHILNLSLGWSYGWSPDRAGWRIAMENTMNAGVIAAVAAGNEGSLFNQPNNVRTPGDCPAPWKHPDQSPTGGRSAAVTVGSTMVSDIISGFSSRGPVTWNNIPPFNDYPLNPGMGLIAPDVVAPGSDILSLSNSNNAGYFVQNGTSMATPAVAGVMALMLSKNPGLSIVQMNKIIEESAIKLTPTKSNTYGSGRIDALAAITSTPFLGVQYYSHTINDSLGNNNGFVNPGEIIKVSLEMENQAAVAYDNVVLQITSDSQHVTLLDTLVFAGNFEAEETRLLENIFRFQALETLPGNYEIGFVLKASSSDHEEDFWMSSFRESAYGPYIEILEAVIDDSQFGNENGKLEPGELVSVIFPVKNTGQTESSPVIVTTSIENPWVYVLSDNVFHAGPMQADSSKDFELQIGVLTDTPMGTSFDVFFQVESDHHTFQWYQTLLIGEPFVFTNGPIPSSLHNNPNTNTLALEPGLFTVTIPEGATITGVDVSYDMISHNGGWISDQRSYLRCVSDGGAKETVITSGSAISSEGRESYARTDLDIANGVAGNEISFELHTFRLWGGTGSNTDFAFVADSTWKINVQYQLPHSEQVFRITNNLGEALEGAAIEIAGETHYTGAGGEVSAMVVRGCNLVSVSAHKHNPVNSYFVHLQEGVITEIELERIYGVAFDLSDPSGNPVANALIYLNGELIDGIDKYGIENGLYNYLAIADGFARIDGQFEMLGEDILIERTMNPAFNVLFQVAGEWGEVLTDAVISLDGQVHDSGVYEFIELLPGHYGYTVEAKHYFPSHGSFEVIDSHQLVSVVLAPDGTAVPALESSVNLYPNPAKGMVYLEFSNLIHPVNSVDLINYFGQMVWKSNETELCKSENCKIDISLEGLNPGIYFLRVKAGNMYYNEKLVVQ